jgi:hypothetical protein
MKKHLFLLVIPLLWFSCQSNSNKISKYFTKSEQDTLLTNIITYVYVKAPYATNSNRFDAQFREFYRQSLPKFSFQNYYVAPDDTHYFFLIRPVGNSSKFKRGVLGKFRLKKDSLMPTQFEEIVNTPHLEEKTVVERGKFLFQELIKSGNLNKYIAMKHYIEWPDERLVYDKKINEWVGVQSTVDSLQSTEVKK